jgi:hypothetical protein
MWKRVVVFSLTFLLIFPFLFSQEAENKILSALEELKKGNTEKVIELLSEAIMELTNKMDFQVKEIIICSEVRDYRDYSEMTGNLKAGDTLLLYIEPEGYYVVKENGSYKIHVSEDVSIVNENGKSVFEKKDWIVYERSFPSPMIPFYITNSISDIPAGKYKYTLTLKDHYKKTFTTETFEFVVE